MGKTRFVTFYSFKGGVGRTLALGNVAWEAARQGKRVVIMDFDLEAPGISSLLPFQEPVKKHVEAAEKGLSPDRAKKGGLFEFILDFRETRKIPCLKDYSTEPLKKEEFMEPGEIIIIPAGREDSGYRNALQGFNWEEFYENENGRDLFNVLRSVIELEFNEPDLVLIDSRTGLSDTAGICTILLPDTVIVFTGLNDQNINGCKSIVASIEEKSSYRVKEKYIGPIEVILVAGHVPDGLEVDTMKKRLEKARMVFNRDLDLIFPYVPILSLEERLLVSEQGAGRLTLVKEYRSLFKKISGERKTEETGIVVVRDPADGSEMVLIPEGSAVLGSREDDREAEDIEKPQKMIHLPSFYMDLYPVTNGQFSAFLNSEAPSEEKLDTWINLQGNHKKEDQIIEKCRIMLTGKTYGVEPGYDNHPMIFVTLPGAKAYAEWAGKRIPTREEWEKAARGKDGRTYPWGNEFNSISCNSEETGINGTSKVNRFPDGKSFYGCFDMAGNIWEWTGSKAGDSEKRNILKGGSWNYKRRFCRCAAVKLELPLNANAETGFRCAKRIGPDRQEPGEKTA